MRADRQFLLLTLTHYTWRRPNPTCKISASTPSTTCYTRSRPYQTTEFQSSLFFHLPLPDTMAADQTIANRWIPAGLSFSIFLYQLDFSHSSKFKPILPLPHLGLVTDPSHPRGPLLKKTLLFFSNLHLHARNEPKCSPEKRWPVNYSGHNSLKPIPQLEFLKSLWGLGTEDE